MNPDLYCPGCGAGLSFAAEYLPTLPGGGTAGPQDATTYDRAASRTAHGVVCRCGRRFSREWMRSTMNLAPGPEPRPAPVPTMGHELGAVLGHGGMGQVVIARDTALEREVVVKQLLERGRNDARTISRFLREARITGALEHPNIVPVHALGLDADGSPFFTMKRVGGQTLAAIIGKLRAGEAAARRRFNLVARLQLFRAVCHAVAFAHSRSVIHRDLKPDNVMVDEFGEVLVMDWGLAKYTGRADGELNGTERGLDPSPPEGPDAQSVTHVGAILGTPRYMSPEQALGHGDKVGPAADVYALGAILYELLALRPAFDEPTLQILLVRVAEGRFVPPGEGPRHEQVPRELAAVATKAMATDPTARYPGALELLADVEAYLGGYAVSAVRDSRLRALAKWARRNRAATIGALALALGTGGMAMVQHVRRDGAIRARLAQIAPRLSEGEAAQLGALEDLERLLEQTPGHARTLAMRDDAAAALSRGLAASAEAAYALSALERGASLDAQEAWYAAHSRVLASARRLARRGGDEAATRATMARIGYRLARQLTQEGSRGMARLVLDEAAEHGLDTTLVAAERQQLQVAPRLRAERARRLLRRDPVVPPFPSPAGDELGVVLAQLAGPELTGVLTGELDGSDPERHRLVLTLLAGTHDATSRESADGVSYPEPPEPETAETLPQRLAIEVYRSWHVGATRGGALAPNGAESLALRVLVRAIRADPHVGARADRLMGLERRRDVLDLSSMRALATMDPARTGAVIAAVAWSHRPLSRAWTLARTLARQHPLGAGAPRSLSPACRAMVSVALGTADDTGYAPALGRRQTALLDASLALDAGARARGLVDAALALDPQCAETHVISGAIYEREGNLVAAAKALRRAAGLAPDWLLPRLAEAAMARRAGRMDLARILAFGIPERMDGLELALERARVLLAEEKPLQALGLLDRMLFEAGQDPDYLGLTGEIQVRLGLPNAAYRNLDAAARTDPGNPIYALTSADHPEDLPSAKVRALAAVLKRRLAERPTDVSLLLRSARLDVLLSRIDRAALTGGYSRKTFYDMGLAALNTASGGGAPEVLLERAALLARVARHDEAIADVLAATAGAPIAPAHARLLARLRLGKGDTQGAIADLERGLALADEPATHAELGIALVRSGRDDEGRTHLEGAIAAGHRDPEASLVLARLAAVQGDRVGALAHYARAHAHQPYGGERVLIDDERRPLLLGPGATDSDLRTALEDLNDALSLDPRRYEYRIVIADLNAHFGYDSLALLDVRRVLAEAPAEWEGRAEFQALAVELSQRLERH